MGYNSAKRLGYCQPILFTTCRKKKKKKFFLPNPEGINLSKNWTNLQPFQRNISTALLAWLSIARNPGGKGRGEECNPGELWFYPMDAAPAKRF